MANVITTLLKLDATNLRTGLKQTQAQIAQTDGVIAKAKTGWTSLFSTFASSPVAIAGATAAIGTFITTTVTGFQEAALEAGKFADATGLTNEAASRLLEVAGDIGVSVGSVEGAVAKMNQAIGTGGPLIDELGLSLQTTADGAADVNATFIDTVRRINAITDPTERAAAAAKVFGRGYKEAAELIGLSADELKAKLDDVGDAQVFGDEQVRKARELRAELDDVQDSAGRVSRAFGETLVPILADAAATVNNLIDSYDRLKAKVPDAAQGGPVGTLLGGLINPTQALSGAMDGLNRATARLDQALGATAPGVTAITDAVTDAADGVDDLDAAMSGAAGSADELGSRWAAAAIPLEGASGAMAEMRSHADDLADSTRDVGDAASDAERQWNPFLDGLQKSPDIVDQVTAAFNGLDEDLGELDAFDDILDQFDRVEEAQKDAAEGGAAELRDYNREVRKLQGQLADFARGVENLPAKKLLEIEAAIRTGDLEALKTTLDDLTKDRFINVITRAAPQDAFSSLNASLNPATGTATPIFNNPSGPSSSTVVNQTIIYPVGSTPTLTYQNQLIDDRRNGAR
jgi:methyl-accepting chemotaxis protein